MNLQDKKYEYLSISLKIVNFQDIISFTWGVYVYGMLQLVKSLDHMPFHKIGRGKKCSIVDSSLHSGWKSVLWS